MSESEALLALAADVEETRTGAAERGWAVQTHDGLVVVLDLTSAVDKEVYRLQLACLGYPDRAPSITLVDPATGRSNVVRAWPACDGFRPPTDICMPLSAEGFVVHPEWMNDPALRWSSSGNPLLRVLEEIQAHLDNPARYHGRAS
jgi:hypothetical protein